MPLNFQPKPLALTLALTGGLSLSMLAQAADTM